MISQKNGSQKHCIKCAVLLTNENWTDKMAKRSCYLCKSCFKKADAARQAKDSEYTIKQRNRARRRRSAVIFSYGNKCKLCYEDRYERLTIAHDGTVNNIIDYLYNNKLDNNYYVICYNCNYSKTTIYKDRYALRYKQKAIAAYGERCTECQEYRIERLTIVSQVKKLYTGARMYRWLIKNKFPKDLGLQVLCYNCNCSKRALLKLYIEEPIKT